MGLALAAAPAAAAVAAAEMMDARSADSCSARARRFAEDLARAMTFATFADDRSPAHILGGAVALALGDGAQLSTLERALGEAALASIAAGEGDSDEEMRAAVLRDMAAFLQARVVDAGAAAAENAQNLCFERQWGQVAVVAGSQVAEDAVAGMAASVAAVAVVDAWPRTPGKALAQRLARRRVAVRYGLLAAAEDLVDGADALLLGAEEVAMNGAVLVAAGAAAVAALCREKGVPVVVVAQTAKFSDGVLVDPEVGGRDVLKTSEIDVIVTENGNVDPIMAPRVLKRAAVRGAAGAPSGVMV